MELPTQHKYAYAGKVIWSCDGPDKIQIYSAQTGEAVDVLLLSDFDRTVLDLADVERAIDYIDRSLTAIGYRVITGGAL